MIVYVGNMLSKHGSSINFMELLIPKLSANYEIKAASSKENKFLRLIDMLACIFMNRKKCKLVLIDTYSTQAFLYAKLAGRFCKWLAIPYVPILHGGNLPERFEQDTASAKGFLSGAKNIVSPSLYLQVFFTSKGFRVHFIPNFIDLSNYDFLSRNQVQPKLLWVRAFQEIYNPTLAIKVLKIILTRYPNAELCMVGAAKDYTFDEVNSLIAKLGIEKYVKITGVLPKADWIQLSKNYDVFINTTTIDNMPISVIEAMALGLPVISTKVGGIPFLIQHENEGLLVPSDSAEDMASAIINLVENPEKVKLLTKLARTKVEGFAWNSVKVQWLDLIDNG